MAHDPDIQDAYFDGVLWVEPGEKPDDLLSKIVDFIEILTGPRPGFQTIDAGAAALGDALSDRRILMIVDDVWREPDLRPFLRGGRNSTRLITTRLNRVLPVDAFRQSVDAMKGDELSPPAILEQRLSLTPPGAETARLEGHADSVVALCMLPDGRLASGSADNTIRLWGVTAGAETAGLEGHSSSVNALCMLPDGRLASGSHDNTIRLWDVTAGAEIARLEVDAPVTCIASLPCGRLVAGDTLGRLHWLEMVD